MRRRIHIDIDRIVVDRDTGLDRGALTAAIERELAAQLRAPGAAAALTHRYAATVDGGTVGGDIAGVLGRRIGTIVVAGGKR